MTCTRTCLTVDMVSEKIRQHVEIVRALSRPGQALGPDAPTSTIYNKEWWIDGEPTPARSRLHRRLLEEARTSAPGVQQENRALVLAGPPGAGKGAVKNSVLDDEISTFLNIDADELKRLLLDEAKADGSYSTWIVPDAIRQLEGEGEQFFPLELASLVHEESSYLAKALRGDAIQAGDNIIIDAVLADEAKALALGVLLEKAGYDVGVVDVEVPFELSEQRIRLRWMRSYEAALASGGTELGGRWVPSEYARDVFAGPEGSSKPEVAARSLAEKCEAVTRYRVYRTGMDQAHTQHATPVLEVDKQRTARGARLVDVEGPGADDMSGRS